jgi:hypothetical protein
MRLAALLFCAVFIAAFASAAPASRSPICGPTKTAGSRFSIACAARDNSHLSVVLSGSTTKSQDATGDAFDKITVFRDGAKLQEIAAQGEFSTGDDRLVEFVDINFDGFDDIRVMTSTSAGPNVGFDYWLYNPHSGKFEHSDIGDTLSGFDIMPDARTKTISVTGRSSCCEWENATYKWSGPALRIRSLSSNGLFNINTPPLEQDGPQFCGTETKHFDDAGGLVSVDYQRDTAKGACTDGDGPAEVLPDLLQLFQKKQKGYATTGSRDRFMIRYATPLPGHDSL